MFPLEVNEHKNQN